MLNNKSAAELAADLFILIIKPIIVLQHTKKRPHYCTDALLNIQCHSKTLCDTQGFGNYQDFHIQVPHIYKKNDLISYI